MNTQFYFVVSSCGAAHQASDWSSHKSICDEVKLSREKLEREEASLRVKPSDESLPEDVFTNGVGRFWGLYDTRDYMRARFQAADALIKANTWVSIEKALEHLMDMLRLCRSDNMGVRDIIPGLMMRLGQEQECYDFLKWWATCDPDGHYDWGDMSLPYLNTRNADAFESTDVLRSGGRRLSLPHLAILTLLKLSLALDLEHAAREEDEEDFGGSVFGVNSSSDIEDPTRRPIGKIVETWMERSQSGGSPGEMAAKLTAQYTELIGMVHKANLHFWEALLDDELPPLPGSYTFGSREEAYLAVHYCRAAYEESWDALVMIDTKTAKFFDRRSVSDILLGSGKFPIPQGTGGIPAFIPGTGKVFPTIFKPPTPATLPEQLITSTFSPQGDCHLFIHRHQPKTVFMYTDGACLNNGQPNPRGGWSVVYGPGSTVSGRPEEQGPFGDRQSQTSNRAELRAVIAALRIRTWGRDEVDTIIIATDSSYSVDGATGWTRGWLHNGWKTRTGENVKNKDLWEALLGEIERCHDQGVAVKFWKLPRELNTEADQAAKAAASMGPIESFRDPKINTSGRATTTTPAVPGNRIVAICLEYENIFDGVHAHLVSAITAYTKRIMERATTPEDTIKALTEHGTPSTILITDGAITRQKNIFEKVATCLRVGATVVLCGCFSSFVNEGEFTRFFARLGLPWTRGSYHRAITTLRRDAVSVGLAKRLPSSYSQKALYVKGLDRSAMWYTETPSSTEAAAALVNVGNGKLGYIGDVNGEDGTTPVILAMCGLLD